MKEWIRNNILMCLEPRFEQYVLNTNECLSNKESEMAGSDAAKVWIKQIQEIMNFIDGINKMEVTANV